jgi:hypothetical protein
MNGRLYYKDSAGKFVLDRTNFNVKTSIIHDELNEKIQILYYFEAVLTSHSTETNFTVMSNYNGFKICTFIIYINNFFYFVQK